MENRSPVTYLLLIDCLVAVSYTLSSSLLWLIGVDDRQKFWGELVIRSIVAHPQHLCNCTYTYNRGFQFLCRSWLPACVSRRSMSLTRMGGLRIAEAKKKSYLAWKAQCVNASAARRWSMHCQERRQQSILPWRPNASWLPESSQPWLVVAALQGTAHKQSFCTCSTESISLRQTKAWLIAFHLLCSLQASPSRALPYLVFAKSPFAWQSPTHMNVAKMLISFPAKVTMDWGYWSTKVHRNATWEGQEPSAPRSADVLWISHRCVCPLRRPWGRLAGSKGPGRSLGLCLESSYLTMR